MRLINQFLNALTDGVLGPLAGRSAWAALFVAALLAAGLLVALFHLSSDQTALRRTRNRFIARLLELLLFQHDLRVNLSALGRILWANGAYLGAMLRPILVATVPLVLIFIQLACWFEWRPLRVGETAVLEVELEKSHPVEKTAVKVTMPAIASQDSPEVRTVASNEWACRVKAAQPGISEISVEVANATENKRLNCGDSLARVSPLRSQSNFWNELLYPSEPALASGSPITRVEISYPERKLLFLGYEIHWSIAAVILMMILGLVVGKLFGVQVA